MCVGFANNSDTGPDQRDGVACQVITALTRGRIETKYTTESMTPTIPVKSQNSTISVIHIPFDDPAAVNAPLGREMESISAQIGITSATRAITRTI